MYNVAMNADQLNSALVTLLSKMALPADEAAKSNLDLIRDRESEFCSRI